ncbi:hypothetical protein HMSSN139_07570 [Paenibacillus sp. HMSSN-139]|nr:hypothetical protein HMSSN139_07570 [Paenibacillus sp. HMSSN-139]
MNEQWIRISKRGGQPVKPYESNRARMLISCPDGPGIVAAVSRFLYEHGANIVQSDQYTMDPEGGMFLCGWNSIWMDWTGGLRR